MELTLLETRRRYDFLAKAWEARPEKKVNKKLTCPRCASQNVELNIPQRTDYSPSADCKSCGYGATAETVDALLKHWNIED